MKFNGYQTEGFYDEIFLRDRDPRPEADPLVRLLESLPEGDLERRQKEALRLKKRKPKGIARRAMG